jgi:uncharacterized membrane protein YjfL (UPF0719 family)
MVEVMTVTVQLVKLVISIIIAVIAQYLAIKVFDWMTTEIDEMAELKKGNVAVGVVLGAVVISIAAIIASGISGLLATTDWMAFAQSFMWLIVAIIIAVGAQFVALSLFMSLTKGIDEQKELKRGNVAVGVVLGAIMIALALVIQAGMPKF